MYAVYQGWGLRGLSLTLTLKTAPGHKRLWPWHWFLKKNIWLRHCLGHGFGLGTLAFS